MQTLITYRVHNHRRRASLLLCAGTASCREIAICCSCVCNKRQIHVTHRARDIAAQTCRSSSAAKLKLRYLNRRLQPKLRITR